MRIIIPICYLLFLCLSTSAQPLSNRIVENSRATVNEVTVFEHWNYTGRSKSFGVGTYRFYTDADFNDIISSIRVPAGMGVIVYEHANEKGGFGNSVDLLEDCPDLSIYDFNDKISYIDVFMTSKPEEIYVRNKLVNGFFVPGHWQRKGTTEIGNGTTGVVSSVLSASTSSAGNATTTVNVTFKPVLKLIPGHIRGDRDFYGNGPYVTASVSIRISGDQKRILGYFKATFSETKADNTTAEIDDIQTLYEAPGGKKIIQINSSQVSQTEYTDADHKLDRPPVFGGSLVNLFEINGDTDGDDVGNDTDDDSYMNVFFNPTSILLSDIPELPAEFPYNGYEIINEQTGMRLEVQNGKLAEKNLIWQNSATLMPSEHFILLPHNGTYMIRSTISDLLFTVRMTEPGIPASNVPGIGTPYYFLQDKQYIVPRPGGPDNGVTVNNLNNQLWNLIPAGEEATYFLEPKAFLGMVLQSPNDKAGQLLMLAQKTNINSQKWIIRRSKRDNSEAQYGYKSVWVDAPGINSTIATTIADWYKDGEINAVTASGDNLNVNAICPQHRSVGEMQVYGKPIKSYERLEGIVADEECHVATVDFPTSHYTHDMNFRVIPNPSFQSLLATKSDDPDFQKDIEVEWETGLGQDQFSWLKVNVMNLNPSWITHPQTLLDSTIITFNNPAVPFNVYGNSFGFFTEGHKRRDIIWNWPVSGDSVSLEGMWIWERGHGDAHTEIHPPHFLAIKRHLPVSFTFSGGIPIINNKPTDQFYGQRVDVFASADGSTQWNTKNLKIFDHIVDFAQVVDMNRKDYVFTVTPMFAPPSPHSQLKWFVINRPGNTFLGKPDIQVIEGGKQIRVVYPWKSKNISNTIKVAQTIIIFWDFPETKGILAAQKPIHFSIQLNTIHIIDNYETGSGGECIFYSNVGSEWLMLNEFTTREANVLKNGLGDAEDDKDYEISSPSFDVYLPTNQTFRIYTDGWENDAMNDNMGNVINEYERSTTKLKPYIKNIFNVGAIANGGIEDDEMSEAKLIISGVTTNQIKATIPSAKGKYRIVYTLIKTQ